MYVFLGMPPLLIALHPIMPNSIMPPLCQTCLQPRQGDALIFFPAFADGRFDDRMAHAGMPVKYGE